MSLIAASFSGRSLDPLEEYAGPVILKQKYMFSDLCCKSLRSQVLVSAFENFCSRENNFASYTYLL
jgi:hypothetical protein